MTDKIILRGHPRPISPIEMCLSMEQEELICWFTILKPDEQMCFIYEFDHELANVIRRYQEIKTSVMLPELKKAYVLYSQDIPVF